MTDIPQFGEPTTGYKDRPSAYAVAIHDGKILVMIVNGHRYFLPGGGIDGGETAEQAVVREVKEESGYRVVSLKEIGKANQFLIDKKAGPLNKLGTFFLITVDLTDVGHGQEADHVPAWVSPEDFFASRAHAFSRWAVRQVL